MGISGSGMVIWLQTATNAVKMAHMVSVLAEKREVVRDWVWVDMGVTSGGMIFITR